MPGSTVMTVQEAARYLGVSPERIWHPMTARQQDSAVPSPCTGMVGDRPAMVGAAYRAGRSIAEIARDFGVTYWRVRQILHDTDTPIRSPGNRDLLLGDADAVASIVDAYTRLGHTIEQIAAAHGVSYSTIHRVLVTTGTPRRKPGDSPRRQLAGAPSPS